MPTRVDRAVSDPGAPLEPQRTPLRIGSVDPASGALLRMAAGEGLFAQEALEPSIVDIATSSAVPALVTGELDLAVMDVATFIGERELGWDGVAVASFGPRPSDRSCAVAAVEAHTWAGRGDMCERLVRAAVRALALVRAGGGVAVDPLPEADLSDWWEDCRPSLEELDEAVRWEPGLPSPALASGLAWLPSDGAG